MKNFFLLLTAALLCHTAVIGQKTRAGLSAGIVMAKMSGELNGDKNGHELKPGYTFGLVIDAPINTKFSFSPGLHFVQKGTLQEPPMGTLITKSYISLRYAELNANFIYKASGVKGNFFIGAGPSLDLNLPSKKGTQIEKDKTETDISFGETIDKDLRGVDYGVNFLTGYRLSSGFFVSLNYNMGLRDLRPVEASAPGEIKNSYFGLQFGWLLQNKEN